MFGLLQVCLFSMFAEGLRADTREKEGSKSSITSLCSYSKREQVMEVRKDGLSGFLPACVIW